MTSDERNQNLIDEACVICLGQGHGIHFNVVACRACAGFYRRTVVEGIVPVCEASGKCEVTLQYRSSCKACRFAKCQEKGMSPENVQYNREPIGPIRRTKGRPPMNRPTRPYIPKRGKMKRDNDDSTMDEGDNDDKKGVKRQPKPEPEEPDIEILISSPVNTVVEPEPPKVMALPPPPKVVAPPPRPVPPPKAVVTRPPPVPPAVKRPVVTVRHDDDQRDTTEYWKTVILPGTIQAMVTGYQRLLERRPLVYRAASSQPLSLNEIFVARINLDPVETVQTVKLEEVMRSYRLEIELIADMVMLFEPFSKLFEEDKSLIFKHFWTSFLTLERCYQTWKNFGKLPDADEYYMITSQMAVKLNEFDIDTADMSTHCSKEELMSLFKPATDQLVALLLKPMRRIDPDQQELMTMVGYLLWNVDGLPGISHRTKQAAEYVKQVICNDMHEHYMSKLKPNYALRLSQLMAIVSAVETIAEKEKEDLVMDKMFNMSFSQLDETIDGLMH